MHDDAPGEPIVLELAADATGVPAIDVVTTGEVQRDGARAGSTRTASSSSCTPLLGSQLATHRTAIRRPRRNPVAAGDGGEVAARLDDPDPFRVESRGSPISSSASDRLAAITASHLA